MRIISGKYRGKRLVAPKNLPARPTTDFAKEALFNILRNRLDLDEVDVLDLFCGTGNISYEFASRDTKSILAVDKNYGCIKFVQETADALKMDQLNALKSDAFTFIEKCHVKFDLIFADPPYDLPGKTKLIDGIFDHQLLKEDGFFILEHSNYENFSEHPLFVETKKYSSVNFSFFYNKL